MIWRPVVVSPRLCEVHQLDDGTYSINDLMDFHEILDFKEEIVRRGEVNKKAKELYAGIR